jgi:hypothetical protein
MDVLIYFCSFKELVMLEDSYLAIDNLDVLLSFLFLNVCLEGP